MAVNPLRAQVRGEGNCHKVLLPVPRSPTPRANCSSRPPMAPEGLGAAARSPTVLLYAAKKAERTSCSRVSRSLRAASLWGRREGGRQEKERITLGQHPRSSSSYSCHSAILLSSLAQASIWPVVTLPLWSMPQIFHRCPPKPFLSVLRLLFLMGHWPDFYGKPPFL